jgi:tripartite-type tricarboxylate transporter receptor subunit TctC
MLSTLDRKGHPKTTRRFRARRNRDIAAMHARDLADQRQTQSRALSVVATGDRERFADLPDVPTFSESGIDIVGRGWFGVYAPANTPPAAVERLNKIIVGILKAPNVRERITALGLRPTGTSPAELAEAQKTDLDKWGPVIKASGFTLD